MMNRTILNFSRICAPINGAQIQAKKGAVTPTEYLVLDVGRLDENKLG